MYTHTQIVQRHSHATMSEVFYVLSGKGVFMIDDIPHVVANGSFVHLPPREPHAVLNRRVQSGKDACHDRSLLIVWTDPPT